jgi:hypothetical protein
MPPAPTRPENRGFAEIDVEPVHRQADQPRHDLRLDPVIDPLQPGRAGGADGFGLHLVHLLDVLGQQLGEEADGGEGQGEETRERAEAEDRHQQDGDDDLVERPESATMPRQMR